MALLQVVTCKCVSISRRRVVLLRWSQHSKRAVAANCSERSPTALYSPSRLSSPAPQSSTVCHDRLRQFGCQAHKSYGIDTRVRLIEIQLILRKRNNKQVRKRRGTSANLQSYCLPKCIRFFSKVTKCVY